MILTGNLAVLIADLKLGGKTGIHLLFIGAIAVNFYLFSLKQKKQIIIASILPVVGMFLVTLFPDILESDPQVSPELEYWSYFIGYITSTFLIVMISYSFVTTSAQFEIELEEKNQKLSESLVEILEQKDIINLQRNEIMDSLNYAKVIQESTLPKTSDLEKYFTDHFIFFQPREQVSGDFYWADNYDGLVYFAVADCTRHATPGTMLSMIGTQILNNAVHVKNLKDPDKILDYLNLKIKDTL